MPKKILIIDDKFDDLKTIENVLEKQKYSITTTTDPRKALDLIKKGKFDLILIDILMPTLSGYDLLRLLREKLNQKVKIVFISIVPKREVVMGSIDGFIQKPFSTNTLLKGIKKAFE